MDPHMESQVSLTSSKSGELNKATSSQERQQREFENIPSPSTSWKPKACKFPAQSLEIGTWKKMSKNDGDIVVKIYFRREMMVWEFLEEALKRKIEMPWSHISAITASLDQGKHGHLKIELNQPPQYYNEIPPEPQKQTKWTETTDFTEGQAPRCRRHWVTFKPGVLDKHYGDLLRCDSRLLNLSRQPFPTLNNSFFTNSSLNHELNSNIDVPNSDPQTRPEIPDLNRTPNIDVPNSDPQTHPEIPDLNRTPNIDVPNSDPQTRPEIPDLNRTPNIDVPNSDPQTHPEIPDLNRTPNIDVPNSDPQTRPEIPDLNITPNIDVPNSI